MWLTQIWRVFFWKYSKWWCCFNWLFFAECKQNKNWYYLVLHIILWQEEASYLFNYIFTASMIGSKTHLRSTRTKYESSMFFITNNDSIIDKAHLMYPQSNTPLLERRWWCKTFHCTLYPALGGFHDKDTPNNRQPKQASNIENACVVSGKCERYIDWRWQKPIRMCHCFCLNKQT